MYGERFWIFTEYGGAHGHDALDAGYDPDETFCNRLRDDVSGVISHSSTRVLQSPPPANLFSGRERAWILSAESEALADPEKLKGTILSRKSAKQVECVEGIHKF